MKRKKAILNGGNPDNFIMRRCFEMGPERRIRFCYIERKVGVLG